MGIRIIANIKELNQLMSPKISGSKLNVWGEEKTALFLQKYPHYTNKELQEKYFPEYTIDNIKAKAGNMKLKKDTNNPKFGIWKDHEIELLKEVYPNYINKELSEKYFPQYTPSQIYNRANSLGLKKDMGNPNYKAFTSEEDDLLKEVFPLHSNRELKEAHFPNHTIEQIRRRAAKFKLKKLKSVRDRIKKETVLKRMKDNNQLLSKEDLDIIKNYYPIGGVAEVKKRAPHLSNTSIYRNIDKMNIEKIQTAEANKSRWEVDRIMMHKDNPFSITVVYKKD